MISFKLLNNKYAPLRNNPSDAGLDLRARVPELWVIPPMTRLLIPTGVILADMPDGWVGLIWPRSGLAHKSGAMVMAGVVNAGYRNEIGVILFNAGSEPIEIHDGDRIAQLVIQPVYVGQIEVVTEIAASLRGKNGFGSSGV